MKLEVYKNQEEASQRAYEIIAAELNNNQLHVMGLATGSTPLALYNILVNSDLDFSNVSAANLDEYKGLEASNDQSYAYFMREHLFKQKPFLKTYIPDGTASDAAKECDRYNAILKDHPIDIQILGIGSNAHIGFNEPGTSFESQTQLVDLTPETIEANKRFFESANDVPKQAFSMGIASIMSAKKIILMAFGTSKAEAIRLTVEGSITEDVPASILQNHKDVIILCDEEAASQLKK